jgi:F-type H+-transporting ATPase subunit epsilon
MIHVQVITPVTTAYNDEVDQVTVPTVNGQITILPHHVSLLTQVVPGELTVKKAGKDHHMAITGGFLEVAKDSVTLLVDYAVRSENIEYQKVLEAQKRAEEKVKQAKEKEIDRDFALAEAELARTVAELQVFNKRRRNSNIPQR